MAKAMVEIGIEDKNGQTTVNFTEIFLPSFENVAGDMTGWLIHMTRLEKMFENRPVPEIPDLQREIEPRVRKIISGLTTDHS